MKGTKDYGTLPRKNARPYDDGDQRDVDYDGRSLRKQLLAGFLGKQSDLSVWIVLRNIPETDLGQIDLAVWTLEHLDFIKINKYEYWQ